MGDAPREARSGAGDQVLLRHTLRGRTWCLLPVTVLRAGSAGCVVRISAGTEWLAASRRGQRVRLGNGGWRLGTARWTGNDLTYFLRPRDWYAIGLLAAPEDGAERGWYVNFQQPYRHRPWGLDTLDLELDLVRGSAAGSSWSWKDREEFHALRRTGLIGPHAANQVLRAARTARARAHRLAARGAWREPAALRVPVPDLRSLLARLPLPPDVSPAVLDRRRPPGDSPSPSSHEGAE
ncbi:DUF402 domain-containing protein [Streptomyces koyangensis]|uniref:DUF402 domain-containing protein n=1 Tax=Streptomyces koyangensis TaxID=188770 RepID=UPI003C2FAB5C